MASLVDKLVDNCKKSMNRREFEVLILPLMAEVQREQARTISYQVEQKVNNYLSEVKRLSSSKEFEINENDSIEDAIMVKDLYNVLEQAKGIL